MTTPREWRGTRTLAEVAKLAGLSGRNVSRTWQRWERGERSPPVEIVARIEQLSCGEITAATWAANLRKARSSILPPAVSPGQPKLGSSPIIVAQHELRVVPAAGCVVVEQTRSASGHPLPFNFKSGGTIVVDLAHLDALIAALQQVRGRS